MATIRTDDTIFGDAQSIGKKCDPNANLPFLTYKLLQPITEFTAVCNWISSRDLQNPVQSMNVTVCILLSLSCCFYCTLSGFIYFKHGFMLQHNYYYMLWPIGLLVLFNCSWTLLALW